MNRARRKMIRKAIDIIEMNEGIEYALDILEDVLYDEEDAYDNIPENLQGSWRASESEEVIDALTEAIDMLTDKQNAEDTDENEAEDKIQEVIDILEEIV